MEYELKWHDLTEKGYTLKNDNLSEVITVYMGKFLDEGGVEVYGELTMTRNGYVNIPKINGSGMVFSVIGMDMKPISIISSGEVFTIPSDKYIWTIPPMAGLKAPLIALAQI